MRFFTKKEDNFLRNNYLTIPAKRMAKMLNRTEGTARQRMKILGIQVPPEIIEKFKKDSQIKPGNIPPNKGRKMKDYATPAAIRAIKKTQFKKGQLPYSTLYDGCITVRTDKRGVKYKWIRLSKALWIPLQRHVWIQANGKIKFGQKIIFKDGNTMNCSLGNLECLTAAQLMKKNSFHTNYPKEIGQLIQLRGALNRKINRHEKQNH